MQMYTAEPAVLGTGDAATVHDLTKEGMQVFPWDLPRGTECIAEKKTSSFVKDRPSCTE